MSSTSRRLRKTGYFGLTLALALALGAAGGELSQRLATAAQAGGVSGLPPALAAFGLGTAVLAALRVLLFPHLLTHVRVDRARLRATRWIDLHGDRDEDLQDWIGRVNDVVGLLLGQYWNATASPRLIASWLSVAALDGGALLIVLSALAGLTPGSATGLLRAANFATPLLLLVELGVLRLLLPRIEACFERASGCSERGLLAGASWQNVFAYALALDVFVYMPILLAVGYAHRGSRAAFWAGAGFVLVKALFALLAYAASLWIGRANLEWLRAQAARLLREMEPGKENRRTAAERAARLLRLERNRDLERAFEAALHDDDAELRECAERALVHNPKLVRFFELAGLRFGERRRDCEARFGAGRCDSNGPWIRYCDGALLVELDMAGRATIDARDKTPLLASVCVRRAGAAELRSRGIDDPNLALLGTPRERIRAYFGETGLIMRSCSETQLYYAINEPGGRRGRVCFGFGGGECEQIWVFWYAPMSTGQA
jgi:hypothetical protein